MKLPSFLATFRQIARQRLAALSRPGRLRLPVRIVWGDGASSDSGPATNPAPDAGSSPGRAMVPATGNGARNLPVAAAGNGRAVVALGGRQSKHLSQSILLEESSPPVLLRAFLLLLCSAVLAFIIWATVATIEEVAISFGQVIPAGRIQAIQHLEGGIVSEILVQDGYRVEPGQVMLRLDPIAVLSELEQARARLNSLTLEAERLRAFATRREPAFPELDSRFQPLLNDQKAILEVQERSRRSQLSVVQNQIEERKGEIEILEEQERTITRQLQVIEEERNIRKTLFDKGLSSKSALLTILREVIQASGELSRVQRQRQQALQSLGEAENRLVELETRLSEDAMNQLTNISSEMAQVTESLRKLEDRRQRLAISAPTGGIVKGLSITTIGGIITPGKIIVEVVPVNDTLQFEARISTRDIGHVREGLQAQVKFAAFDFARYGAMPGILASISATTFLDEKGEPYYRGLVDLERDYLGSNPRVNRVVPGMTGQAEILTGQKTLMEYLLKPIYRALEQGFRER